MTNYSPTAFAREVANRIRGEISRYNVRQVDLAVLCNVSQSQFSKIIRGAKSMSLDQYASLCDALGINPAQLAREVEEFVATRGNYASPIVFVVDGERDDDPRIASDGMLDPFGRDARKRWIEHVADDYELAARPEDPDRGEE